MAIQEQYILSKDPSTGTVLLPQVSNNTAFEIDNDGTAHGLYLHQDGVLDSNKHGLYVYSNEAQVNSDLVKIHQDNASSIYHVQWIKNDGTGRGLYIQQDGVLASNSAGLFVYSNTAQVTSPLARIWLDSASSTQPVLKIDNDGTGRGIWVQQNGNGDGVLILNEGTAHGLYIYQNENLASGKYALYIDNNGTPVDGAGRAIRLDGCTITGTGEILGYIAVNIDGTQRAVPYYAIT